MSVEIENFQEFVYLGNRVTCDNDWKNDIKNRIGKATAAMAKPRKTWNRRKSAWRPNSHFSEPVSCV